MKTDISIRAATIEDIPAILHHRREMFRAMGHNNATLLGRLEPLAKRYFQDAFRAGTFRGWMAVDSGGTIVGGGGIADVLLPPGPYAPTPTRPEIINVFVESAYRRQGIARRLMEVMIDWCCARGYASVFLHSSEDGRPLYSSMGFEPTPEMKLPLK
jgi:GNAT superfamily N-acetyltransferase